MEQTKIETQETFTDLIKDIQFAMMTTTSTEDGTLRSRPMTLQQAHYDGDLYFFVGRSSAPLADIETFPQINLSFSDAKNHKFVSVQGLARKDEDRAKMKELWKPAYRAWFPEGLEDPELALLRVRIESADYWISPGSALAHLFGFVKAILTGQKAGKEIGEHRHLTVHDTPALG